MQKIEAPIIVGLDIGTTKIAAIAGRKDEHGKLEILGFGRANSNGVQHGQVLNIELTVKAINEALNNCYKSNEDLEIAEVYVGIAGHHIKSLQTRGDIMRLDSENEITQDEINLLIENQRKTFIPPGDQIIDVIPQDFHVDSHSNIKDPVGYNGVKVGANFHIITGDKYAIKNINRAVEKSGLKTKDLVLQPLASAGAVMSEIDLEAGVVILDIGGGTSDIAVFHDGVLKHTAVIPFGGENITNDIKIGLGVLKSQAEALKIQFGGALADEANANAYITIPGLRGMPAKEISVKTLSQIIQSRMQEILDFVVYNLKVVGLDAKGLTGGVIITGGGSQLKHLIQLTEYVTGLNARIGLPTEHLAPNHIEELKKPMYSTCLGLILKGYNDFEKQYKEFEKTFVRVKAPKELKDNTPIIDEKTQEQEQVKTEEKIDENEGVDINKRKILKPNKPSIFDRVKHTLIDLFKDEEDTDLNNNN